MADSPDIALSMQHDSILLHDITLPVMKRMAQGIKHTVDADADIILGYSTDTPTASIDVSLGQVLGTDSCPKFDMYFQSASRL